MASSNKAYEIVADIALVWSHIRGLLSSSREHVHTLHLLNHGSRCFTCQLVRSIRRSRPTAASRSNTSHARKKQPHRQGSDATNHEGDGKGHPLVSEMGYTGERNVKKALCIGINYVSSRDGLTLSGCQTDALRMVDILKKDFHYERAMLLLDQTDEIPSGTKQKVFRPTRHNILKGLHWLRNRAKPGDLLFLHYSGHGTQVPDENGDEQDQKDECLVPCDFRSTGYITDDTLVTHCLKLLPKGVICSFLFDCCHSGSILDLPHEYRYSSSLGTIQTRSDPGMDRITEAMVICLSACHDDQVAEERRTSAGEFRGLMTTCVEQAIRKFNNRISLRELLIYVSNEMHHRGASQSPVLSLNFPVDIDHFYLNVSII